MDIRLTTGESLYISEGESILEALKRHGIYLVASCGGKGICGKCRVRLLEGKGKIVSTGKLKPRETEARAVLACQIFPEEKVLIDIPKESRLTVGDKIEISRSGDLLELLHSLGAEVSPIVKWVPVDIPPPTISDSISDLERLKSVVEEKGIKDMIFSHGFVSCMVKALRDADWKVNLAYTNGPEAICISPLKSKDRYGVAVDIGTTTVVVYLINLTDGRFIDASSTYNSQARYGDDVITRIIYATESEGLDELRGAVVTDINTLLTALIERHNIKIEDIESAVVSGNTTMLHLFWGLNPAYIREEPYIPALTAFPLWKADIARLNINPQAPIYTLPCVASYVGGDIVAGVLASKMQRNSAVALFMDIGTNGEIVIGNNEWLVTAACSAGPCFEGSGIRHGMRATEGAVESVRIDPQTFEPTVGIIGGGKPMGICGSGMIDAISEMLLTGIIDRKGRFVKGLKTERIREGFEGPEFLFFSGDSCEVVLTEVDIENILRAKAAIYAGLSLLLEEVGFTLDAIERVYIAGGFGSHLDVDKAIILGMLPDLPKDRFKFLGNTSIAGAYLCLVSDSMRKEAEEIRRKMTYIELSASRRFMDEYVSALFLPHTHMRLFPTVKRLLPDKR